MLTVQALIELLHLEPLEGEGGLFRQTYLAPEKIRHEALPPRYCSARAFGSAIYYLLTCADDSFSALHRLPTDEIYHFYLGDPIEMLLLFPGGGSELRVLGQDLLAGQSVQTVAPRGVWQGSRLLPGGNFALLGTTLAPAFVHDDFELGDRQALSASYPARAARIRALTR